MPSKRENSLTIRLRPSEAAVLAEAAEAADQRVSEWAREVLLSKAKAVREGRVVESPGHYR